MDPSLALPPQKSEEIVWNDQTLALLGKMPDAAIARQFGVPIATVRIKRLDLGLPTAKWQSHRRIQWTPEMDALLGTDFDFVIARKLGMSASSVGSRRKQLKIESWKESNQG